MKTFKEFVNESKSFERIEQYFAKTKSLTFVEDSATKGGWSGSNIGNNRNPSFVAVIDFEAVSDGKKVRIEADVFAPDAHDSSIYGKNVYRYETKAMQSGKLRLPLKIDLSKGMVYMLTEEAKENDTAEFETRGSKIQWLAVYKKETFLKHQK